MVRFWSLVVQAEPLTYSRSRLPLSSTTGPVFATPRLLMETVSEYEPCEHAWLLAFPLERGQLRPSSLTRWAFRYAWQVSPTDLPPMLD